MACSLKGGYLIEASAGTGKTWTLTGILLRLLIEEKYAPEQIIATTFTKAAAAEMQERIHARLANFYRYVSWLVLMRGENPEWFLLEKLNNDDDKQAKLDAILDEICQAAKTAGIADSDDPINRHLLGVLLTSAEPRAPELAKSRAQLLLATLDKLFIGTLDSLAQKWLREFAAEIGHKSETEITNQTRDVVRAILHDELRAEHSRLLSQPNLYALLKDDLKVLQDVDAAESAISLPLQFFGVPIDDISVPNDEDVLQAQAAFGDVAKADLSSVADFFDIESLKTLGVAQRATWQKSLHELPAVLSLMGEHGAAFTNHTNEAQNKWLANLIKTYNEGKLNSETAFKKGAKDADKARFETVMDVLVRLVNACQSLTHIRTAYQQSLYQKLAVLVQQKLGAVLETLGKTTFSLQIDRLNQALKTNPNIARHIRHQYPVALIDEAQDVNGAQVTLIQEVYLNALKMDAKNGKTRGFLLLVGDPKQAIYRFRGGDVTNYNAMKALGSTKQTVRDDGDFGNDRDGGFGENLTENSGNIIKKNLINQDLTLTVNRRSNAALIHALNEWFANSGASEHHNHAYLGTNIFYQPITAHNTDKRLSWQTGETTGAALGTSPLAVLNIKYDKQAEYSEHELIAMHMNSLLQDGHRIQDGANARQILPQDLAFLARSRTDLAQMKDALDWLNIPSAAAKESSVFHTPAADDVRTLLLACLDGAADTVSSLLTSGLFGLTLDDVAAMQLAQDEKTPKSQTDEQNSNAHSSANLNSSINPDAWVQVLSYLQKVRERWQRFGVANALNFALMTNPLRQTPTNAAPEEQESLWLTTATHGERYVADLWQLTEIISAQSMPSEVRLLAWFDEQIAQAASDTPEQYLRRPLPSELGVNLMTIHGSKGLEFPIVYVFGLDKKPMLNRENFYPYSDENFTRRISPTPDKIDNNQQIVKDFYKNLNDAESVDEERRLGYVALTRASEQTFVVGCDAAKNESLDKRALFLWLESAQKELALPERLADVMDWIVLDDDTPLCKAAYQQTSLNALPIAYADWAQVLPVQSFYGAQKTSFTALNAHHAHAQNTSQNSAVHLASTPDYDDIAALGEQDLPAPVPTDDIRYRLPRGANIGTFLHQVLESADFGDEKHVSQTIDRTVRTLNLPVELLSQKAQAQTLMGKGSAPDFGVDDSMHKALIAWIMATAWGEFAASGAVLAKLNAQNSAREMKFLLGLGKNFSIAGLNAAFEAHSDRPVRLDDVDAGTPAWYRHLSGEIDLLYECAGKFYVVDYKSNFLGSTPQDYQQDALTEAMDKAGYWLQAAIYQVALHRLLRLRIKDYVGNEARYLGAVEYVFLRGLDSGLGSGLDNGLNNDNLNNNSAELKKSPETKTQSQFGRLVWQVPLPLVLALDELFD